MGEGWTPLVSVVCATYNRPEHLAVAVRSVAAQSYANWELVVVGDECEEATDDVMASFDDPRIRYHNRPVNHGEQSAPNNDGAAMTSGELVAYINHDDVWLPDHLATSISAMGTTGADIVYAPGLIVRPDDTVFHQPEPVVRRGRLNELAPASTWLVRRSVIDRVGPWHSAFEMHHAPSADWLRRALDDGARVASSGRSTVVIIMSGRPGSYTTHSTDTVPLAVAVLHDGTAALDHLPPSRPSALRRLWQLGWRPTSIGLARLGRHPYVVRTRLLARRHGWRDGDFIRQLRTVRGLERNS